LTYGSRG